MSGTPIELLLEKLPDAKKNGTGWMAKCPSHEDRRPSLSVGVGDDGRALIHCQAGCTPEAVVAALGLTLADLMPPRTNGHATATKPRGKIVKTYPYHDADGNLLFESVRFDPKDFKQRRPDGNGGWIWNLQGVDRVLYGLPALLQVDSESFVFVTEGEKDTDRLMACGIIATTTSGGAGNGHKTDLAPLHSHHVVFLPDNDKAGREHVEALAQALDGKAASIRVLALPGLPEKGDASDWLDAGGDIEDLVGMAEQAPLWTPATATSKATGDTADDGAQGSRPKVSNVDIEEVTLPDGEKAIVTTAKTPDEVGTNVFQKVGPIYALGNRGLFVPDAQTVRFLPDDAAAFAWLKNNAEVYWAARANRGGTVVTRAEFMAHLSACPAERFADVSELPHHPSVPATFYCDTKLPSPNPARLTEFLDHLNPATPTDRALLEAMILTPGSGIQCGARPAFVLASDYGRGSGKTATAEAVAFIWGGSVDTSLATRDGIDRLRQRLLHDSTAMRRVVLLDNLRGTTSNAEIESLITAGDIQGHKLYVGDATRPNRLTWIVTANSPSLSRDLADRSIVIRIGRPHRSDFTGWALRFIAEHRMALVATAIARLAGPALCSIPADCRDRWTAWQDAVLCRVDGGDLAAAEIIARRPSVDADAEDWGEFENEIREIIRAIGHDPDTETVAMPLTVLAARLSATTNLHWTPKGLASRLGEFAGVDGAEQFTRNPSRSAGGRTWLWHPSKRPAMRPETTPEASRTVRVEYPDFARLNPRTLERIDRWT
ncbi:MAG: hypothetical protein WD042_03045 [Phycisphaeraceae bacterium]